MKKYILILLSIISFWSCIDDETVDVTVMPPATTTGENTFGCLVDGWLYVGGRYRNWDQSGLWTSKSFFYDEKEKQLSASVAVNPDFNIRFTILSPKEGEESVITDIKFAEEELENGTAFISRFDTNMKIISGTFGNGNPLTNGRFDVHYTTTSTPDSN